MTSPDTYINLSEAQIDSIGLRRPRCPECGSEYLELSIYNAGKRGPTAQHCLSCMDCGVERCGDTEAEAVNAWNVQWDDPKT